MEAAIDFILLGSEQDLANLEPLSW